MGAPRLIVVKIGSSTLVDERGSLDGGFIASLCSQVSSLVSSGTKVVIVSSGAVAAGRDVLGISGRPSDMGTLQACASAGQARLTQAYADVLAVSGIPCAQVLLTRRDVMDRDAFLNARTTLTRLLELGAIPVVNENDTVSTAEFAFGDNDMLGALVSALVGADLYVICSDVEGLYTSNPQEDPTATLIERVEEVDQDLTSRAGGTGTSFGTGGMSSKLRAARAMLAAGIPTVICRGRRERVLLDVVRGMPVGTRFEAPEGSPHEGGRKLWIGLAEVPRGTITLDEGASQAVLERGASILPVGVVSTMGHYVAGDVVNVRTSRGDIIGRGIARYSSEDMGKVRGIKLDVIARFLGSDRAQPAVHRDDLLVF